MKTSFNLTSLLFIFVISFFLAACSEKDSKDEFPETVKSAIPTSQYPPSEEIVPRQDSSGLDAFATIKEALTKQLTLKCTYKTDEDVFDMHLRGTSAYVEGSNKSEKNKTSKIVAVIKDNKYYVWAEGSAEGMLIDLAKKRDKPLEVNDKPVYSFDNILSSLEESKQSCQLSSLPDSAFEVPTNIKFTSW